MKHYKNEYKDTKNYWEIQELNTAGDILQYEHIHIVHSMLYKEYIIGVHHVPVGHAMQDISKMQEITPEEYNKVRSELLNTLEATRVP